MKPSRKLLSSVIFFTMTSHLVQAASDITITNGPDLDITASTPFKDASNNGGTSNLNATITLFGALGSSDVVVTTASAGANPLEGNIRVQDTITWLNTRTLSLVADSNIVIGATMQAFSGGSLNLNAGSTSTVAFNADVSLSGAPANLTVTSGGISQLAGRKLLIGGQADLNGGAGTVSLSSDNKFGSLKLTGGAVTVNEADATVLTGVSANTLTLTTAGTLTDAAGTSITVIGLANLNAGVNAITLGDSVGDTTNFGSLNLTGTAVTITEDSGSDLAGVGATSLTLTSDGTIVDTGNIGVTGLATFNAGANAITLGDSVTENTNFGSLNLTGGAVTVSEDSATILTGVSASSLTLTSNGTITDAVSTGLVVSGLATFNAGSNAVTLGDSPGDNTRFGSLSVTGSAVNVVEDDSTLLAGMSAATLNLNSAGAITNMTGAGIGVSGLATLSGTSIAVGNMLGDTVNFGSLNFNSTGSVTVQEDSATLLTGTNTGQSLLLGSAGALTNDATTNLTVVNNASFGGTSITLGTTPGDVMNFGSLTFNSGGAVTIQEDSSTLLSGASTAASLVLGSTGAITDAGASLTVAGTANITAGAGASVILAGTTFSVGGNTTITAGSGQDIIISNASNAFTGPVTFVASSGTLANVNVVDTTAFDLQALTVTSTLTAISGGALTDSGNLSVVGLATLGGSTINIGGGSEVTNFGSLKFNSAGAVAIQEDSDTQFVGANTASVLTLTSSGISTFTAGSTLNAVTLDILTQTVALTGNNLVDTIQVKLANGTTLSLSGSDTIGTLISNGGTIAGTGTLTATGGAALNGGTISGHLLGNTTSTGNVLVSGTIGGGSLSVTGGTLTLTGTSTNTPVDISLNAALLDSNGGLDSSALVTNAGLLTVNSADTVTTYTQNGTGTLAGSAALTATGGATLNGGTVSGHLLGNTTSTGNVLVSGSIGGGSLSVTGGTLTLTGTSTNTPVDISLNAALLDSNGGLDSSALVTNAGLLTVNSADTVTTYTQNGTGTLAGSAALTATGGAALNGGTISGHLLGNTTSTGNVLVSGTIGGGSLSVTGGTLTLTGTSTNTPVDISLNAALLDSNGGLDSSALVTNAGLLTVNSADTVTTYTQNGTGTLAGSAALTATGGATLNGGTVSGHLLGNTTSTGNVLVSGSIGGGSLSVTGGTLTLTGTSTNTPVDISLNAALLDSNGGLDSSALVTNAGLLTVNSADTVTTYTQNGTGTLAGSAALTATGGAALNGGTVSGQLLGNTTSTGNVLVSGTIGGGSLSVTGGTLTLTGTSTNTPVDISLNAALLDSNGGLDSSALVTNAGLLTVNSADTVTTYTQNGTGTLAGSAALTATGGATLNGGTVSGQLLGDTTSTGTVLVSGSVGGGFLHVDNGVLTLTGTANSNTTVNANGTLKGTGLVNGNLTNYGTLAVGSMGNKLTVSGDLFTRGIMALSLDNPGSFEQIKAASVDLGGGLVMTNTGAGLANGEMAKVIDANSYSNGLASFTSIGFDNGLLFNDHTGTLIGLGGGSVSTTGGYLNLSGNQTSTYLALFDDSVQPGQQNVTRVKNPSGPGYIVNFTSGASNGDSQLVEALYQSTFSSPGSIDADTMNSLSPEVHRGMVDYTEQALRSHVREAADAAPVSRKGKTQVFATLHTVTDGVDSSLTNAGYDIEMNGATAGMRYDVSGNFRVGGFLGMDDGTISGPLIDTDAKGFVLGGLGTYQFHDAYKTMITGTAAFGNYTYDATRSSYEGDAQADGIGSTAAELALGVSTVLFEKHGLRVSPSGALRYMAGSVDSFVEKGPGIPLSVDSQDIDSVLFDVGFDLSYQLAERVSLVGRVGYVDQLSGSDESVSATFAATGADGVPFAVSAPGVDSQALTLGFGLSYDITESTRVGATYRGEFRTESQSSQTFGVGASYGF